MEYLVQILCVIMLTVVLSLISCQHIENSSREQTGHPVPTNIRRLPNIRNQERFSAYSTINVIVFLLFLHLMLIISNISVLKFFRNIAFMLHLAALK